MLVGDADRPRRVSALAGHRRHRACAERDAPPARSLAVRRDGHDGVLGDAGDRRPRRCGSAPAESRNLTRGFFPRLRRSCALPHLPHLPHLPPGYLSHISCASSAPHASKRTVHASYRVSTSDLLGGGGQAGNPGYNYIPHVAAAGSSATVAPTRLCATPAANSGPSVRSSSEGAVTGRWRGGGCVCSEMGRLRAYTGLCVVACHARVPGDGATCVASCPTRRRRARSPARRKRGEGAVT